MIERKPEQIRENCLSFTSEFKDILVLKSVGFELYHQGTQKSLKEIVNNVIFKEQWTSIHNCYKVTFIFLVDNQSTKI